jgi:hypothetical protein
MLHSGYQVEGTQNACVVNGTGTMGFVIIFILWTSLSGEVYRQTDQWRFCHPAGSALTKPADF